jgi:hypothetical protein
MTIEDYRFKLIMRLRACRDPVAARSLLAEAELMLANSRLTRLAHDRFWESVDDDLRSLEEVAKSVADRSTGAALEAVIAAARARIASYRARVASPSDP